MHIRNMLLPQTLVFKKKRQIAKGVYEFSFVPKGEFSRKAGQHMYLFLPTKIAKNKWRAFSVSSAPSEPYITITTRIMVTESSPYKQALKKLKNGDEVKARGTVGPLYIDDQEAHYAFLASGIGITPYRSILKELAADNSKAKVTLFYVGDKDNHFYREELSELNAKLKNLRIKYIYRPERLTGQIVEETLGDELSSTIFFLSGSNKMVKSYRRTLSGLGVKRANIKSDTFIGYKPHLKKATAHL